MRGERKKTLGWKAMISGLLSALMIAPGIATAQTQHHQGQSTIAVAVPDITLTDQDGRRVRLYTDLMKDKWVILSFFYTTCTGVCPTTGHWLSTMQEKLGPRLGKDVVLISISINPEIDTPEKIKSWSSRWKRKPGWTLLTSKGYDARKFMSKFLLVEARSMHSPVVYLGDGSQSEVEWVATNVLEEGFSIPSYFERPRKPRNK